MVLTITAAIFTLAAATIAQRTDNSQTTPPLAGPRVEVVWPGDESAGMMMSPAQGQQVQQDRAEPTRRQPRMSFDGSRRGRGGGPGQDAAPAGPLDGPVRRALAEVGLTAEQTQQIREAAQAFSQSVQAWRTDHSQSLRELRAQMQQARRDADRSRLRELGNRLQELNADAPKPADLVSKIEAILTKEQADKVRELRQKYTRLQRDEMNDTRPRNQRGDENRGKGRRELDL
jgi:Spy/CpxP family protein refolding chaperone